MALLASLEERIPHSAPVLVIQRQRRERERLAIRELKKSQDILGDLHDRQALIDDLAIETDALPQTGSDDRAAIGLICQLLEADVRHLHDEYLARRHRVVAIVRHEESPTAATRSRPDRRPRRPG